MNLQLGQFIYHKELYWGRERMEVTGIKKNEVLLKGDWSGGTHCVTQEGWMPMKGVLKNRSRVNPLDVIMKKFHQ